MSVQSESDSKFVLEVLQVQNVGGLVNTKAVGEVFLEDTDSNSWDKEYERPEVQFPVRFIGLVEASWCDLLSAQFLLSRGRIFQFNTLAWFHLLVSAVPATCVSITRVTTVD